MTQNTWLPGVHASPNIQRNPAAYEIENEAADPQGRIEQAMREIADWKDSVFLDIGAGTGFHLPRFHMRAKHVIAVEPHDESRLHAMERVRRLNLDNISIIKGSAEQTMLAPDSVDIAHARFAYFWGPGCEKGLHELERIMKPGGTAFLIHNDARRGTFASWLVRSPYYQYQKPEGYEEFWRRQGFAQTVVASEWRFVNRADLELVIRNEFPADMAETILAEHRELHISYSYNLYHKTY